MATREQLEKALRNAHAAGDKAAATRLAAEIRKVGAEPSKAQKEFDDLPLWQKPIKALDDLLRVGSDALTMGGVDYLRAMAGTQPSVEAARQATGDARERSGLAGDAAAIGSSVLPMMLMPQMAIPAKAGPVLQAVGNTALAGLEGSAWGGLDALGHGEDVVTGQAKGLAFGAGGRAVTGMLGKGLDTVLDRGTRSARVEPFDLRLDKERAYNAMEDEGVVYKPSYVDDLIDRLGKDTKDAWPGVNEGALGAVKRARKNLRQGGQGFGRNRTMAQIDKERQNINRDAAGSPDPRDRPYGVDMKKSIDDWMDDATGANISTRSGDPQRGLDFLHKGRELNQRVEKLDAISEKLGKARRQSERNLYSGEDSTIKQNIGGILDDPKKRSMFTPDELEQMEIVNSGTGGQQLLRQGGRMAPGGGLGYFASTGAAGLGLATMGTPGLALGMVPPVVGVLSKKLSERATRKEAERLVDMVSSGKSLKRIPSMSPKVRQDFTRLMIALGLTSEGD